MIELHKQYTLEMPKGAISTQGINLIREYSSAQSLISDEWAKLNPQLYSHWLPALPDDWEWEWIITGKGEYVGTFPKRVSKYYWQSFKIKCPQSFIQEIGNLARQHSNESKSYTFDIVDTFNWNAGDFGDSGSCYWGSHSDARTMLVENNAWAIRLFENGIGYGRAWLARLSDNRFIIFNGYGFPSNSSLTIARIFATWLGLRACL